MGQAEVHKKPMSLNLRDCHAIIRQVDSQGTVGSAVVVQNFGFVVFVSPDPVHKILNMKPIKYNGEHRLNVEEKKPRAGDGRLGLGRGPPPRSGSGGGGGGFSRGGGRGGGGGTRTGGPPAGVRGENRGGLNRG